MHFKLIRLTDFFHLYLKNTLQPIVLVANSTLGPNINVKRVHLTNFLEKKNLIAPITTFKITRWCQEEEEQSKDPLGQGVRNK